MSSLLWKLFSITELHTNLFSETYQKGNIYYLFNRMKSKMMPEVIPDPETLLPWPHLRFSINNPAVINNSVTSQQQTAQAQLCTITQTDRLPGWTSEQIPFHWSWNRKCKKNPNSASWRKSSKEVNHLVKAYEQNSEVKEEDMFGHLWGEKINRVHFRTCGDGIQ